MSASRAGVTAEFFDLPDIGRKGRRARAFLTEHGLVVSATDRDVAAHATAVVLEAIQAIELVLEPRLEQWTTEILRRFSEAPGPITEAYAGNPDVDLDYDIIGIGYVRPSDIGHECGGLLFDRTSRHVRRIEPQTVWVDSGATRN